MERRGTKSHDGFTIVEMLVSCALILIFVTIAYNLYILAKDVWQYVYVQGYMQTEGMLALEKMIHGVDIDHKGVQEAQGLITPMPGSSSMQIEFIDQDDPNPSNPTITRLFYLSGDKLVYTDEDNNNIDLIDSGVWALTFTRPSDKASLVSINLILKRTVLNKDITINLSTSVRLRNM